MMGLVENGHPLLGGDPTPAQWISPPIRYLTCGRAPQGRGRLIARPAARALGGAASPRWPTARTAWRGSAAARSHPRPPRRWPAASAESMRLSGHSRGSTPWRVTPIPCLPPFRDGFAETEDDVGGRSSVPAPYSSTTNSMMSTKSRSGGGTAFPDDHALVGVGELVAHDLGEEDEFDVTDLDDVRFRMEGDLLVFHGRVFVSRVVRTAHSQRRTRRVKDAISPRPAVGSLRREGQRWIYRVSAP